MRDILWSKRAFIWRLASGNLRAGDAELAAATIAAADHLARKAHDGQEDEPDA